MTDKAPEYLSAEELRNRLYYSLRNRGLVNSIKSQLRTNLITELQQSVRGPLTVRDLDPPEQEPLLLRAANSLVADHLLRGKYEYTLGVFLPESGLAQDKIFQPQDLLRLLHISPQSRLYQLICAKAEKQKEKGLLWQIISELAAIHSNGVQDCGIQADLTRLGPVASLDEKLKSLEELYSSKREDLSHSSRTAVEERILTYQRQLEDRYNSQLKLEIARLRDSEIARMRLEEKEKCTKENEKIKKELQRTYQDKYDALVERERNAIERLHKEQELQEKEVYSQRQMLLSEIESIRQRESEIKREAEVNKREKLLAEERVKAKEDELRRRELELRHKEMQFDQRLHNEMAQFKLDQQTKFIDRVQNLEVREAKLKEEERILAEEKTKIQTLKDELRDKTHRINNLESALQEARHSEVTATRQNEFINSKLRDMADYKAIKEQNIQLRNEVETLRTRLSEVLSMNERERGRQEELLRELRRPSPETLMMQRDLERAKENLRQEQVVFEQQKQLLESRLKDELDRNRELVQRLEEQMLQMKEMNREVVDLRKQLLFTQTALHQEVYGKPKEVQETQELPLAPGSSRSRVNASHHPAAEASNRQSPHQPGRSVTPDLDPCGRLGPITYLGDKDVYNQNLERAYQDFHCHMTNVSTLPFNLPSVSTSDALTNAGPLGTVVQTDHDHVDTKSPCQSPIPHDHPKSSTPYRSRPLRHHDDSFKEFSGGKGDNAKRTMPHFDLSNMSDEEIEKKEINLESRHVKSRPITVDDLEARPGSPSMLYVASSESDDALKGTPHKTAASPVTAPSTVLHQISLDDAWKQTPSSLDDAWRRKDITREEKNVIEKNMGDEEQKREEVKEEKIEQNGEEEEAKKNAGGESDNAGIDPVMLQYMAKVKAMKEKEQEEKIPSLSEEISVVDDLKSEHDIEDADDW
ncbi:hypothetical protein C0Q70_06325 [Pomacea canaliculata]|uniref:Uncharacterized protein n=1 Tax=Pomacea canaliculata TaxID=400727 RepID=A0A2T7PNN9_POMCA|nr:hypothetical protein C0Q70_06325 [Pomacea canaliculata]